MVIELIRTDWFVLPEETGNEAGTLIVFVCGIEKLESVALNAYCLIKALGLSEILLGHVEIQKTR